MADSAAVSFAPDDATRTRPVRWPEASAAVPTGLGDGPRVLGCGRAADVRGDCLQPLLELGLLAHGHPHIGVQHIGTLSGFSRVLLKGEGGAGLGGNGQLTKREALEAVGGWNEQSPTEDFDLTMRMLLAGWES